jgi:hypothetical protein
MKSIYRFLILLFLTSGCANNRYLLIDIGKDRRFLVAAIDKAAKTGEISQKPMIVVDGIPYRYDKELKNNRLQLGKKDIKQIDIVKKDVAIKIYGDEAKSGLLLITTKTSSVKDSKSIDKSKVLILLEDIEISTSERDKINPTEVESVDVIKDKEKVKQYTSEDYDGVVIIHMKKKE